LKGEDQVNRGNMKYIINELKGFQRETYNWIIIFWGF